MAATLVLTRGELQQAVDSAGLVTELRSAMAGYQEGGPGSRVRSEPSRTVTAMVLAPGLAPGIPAYTVKVHAKNLGRRPALTGVICLHDLHSGDLLAVLDSGWLTAVRTAAGAALGTLVLARPEASTVGVIGAGEQGRAQLRALASVRRLSVVHVHDPDPGAARAVAESIEGIGVLRDVPVHVHPTARAVAGESEIVLMATWSRTPLLGRADVRSGTHITSLGADEPGKAELNDDLLAASLVVTDDEQLCGDVLAKVDTTLPRLLRYERPGRTNPGQVTVYSPVGLPLQDLVAAWHAYQRARARSLGAYLDLER